MKDVYLERAAQELGLPYEEVLARFKASDKAIVGIRQRCKVAHFNEAWGRLRGRGPRAMKEQGMTVSQLVDALLREYQDLPVYVCDKDGNQRELHRIVAVVSDRDADGNGCVAVMFTVIDNQEER